VPFRVLGFSQHRVVQDFKAAGMHAQSIAHDPGRENGRRFVARRILRLDAFDKARLQNLSAVGDGRIHDGNLHWRYGNFALAEANVRRIAIAPIGVFYPFECREIPLGILKRWQTFPLAQMEFFTEPDNFSMPVRRW
jgi:hypothetical protein